MTDIDPAEAALNESYSEQGALDDLLIKVALGSFGFTVGLGAIADAGEVTQWLRASWLALLGCVLVVLLSKYIGIEGLRASYLSQKHPETDSGQRAKQAARTLGEVVKWLNYVAGLLLAGGAVFVAAHVFALD